MLKKLVQDLRLEKAVVFIEGKEDRRIFLAGCDVFVMASREIKHKGDAEGFGVVYLEAGACGNPVVAGDSGGVRDAVEDGVNGILVDPESPEVVAGAIEKILSDGELAKGLGTRGRERVMSRFDYRNGVPELDPVFRET